MLNKLRADEKCGQGVPGFEKATATHADALHEQVEAGKAVVPRRGGRRGHLHCLLRRRVHGRGVFCAGSTVRTYPSMHTYLASRVHPAAGYVVGGAIWHIHQDRDARGGYLEIHGGWECGSGQAGGCCSRVLVQKEDTNGGRGLAWWW